MQELLDHSARKQRNLDFSFSSVGGGENWPLTIFCNYLSIHYLEYINKSDDFHSLVQRLAIFF